MTNPTCMRFAKKYTYQPAYVKKTAFSLPINRSAMTIRDLLSHLAQYPPRHRVVVGGYEGGYNDITILKTIQLQPDAHTEWYLGQHDEAEQGEPALLLAGENRLSEDFLQKEKGGEG